jgi:hypothetical protein
VGLGEGLVVTLSGHRSSASVAWASWDAPDFVQVIRRHRRCRRHLDLHRQSPPHPPLHPDLLKILAWNRTFAQYESPRFGTTATDGTCSLKSYLAGGLRTRSAV